MTRLYYQHPFSPKSPWNHPIGYGAVYEAVTGLSGLSVQVINGSEDSFSVGVGVASDSDPICEVRFTPPAGKTGSSFDFLDGGGLNCENTAADEAFLERYQVGNYPCLAWPVHYHSTNRANDGDYGIPRDFQRLPRGGFGDYLRVGNVEDSIFVERQVKRPWDRWSPYFRLPSGVCPSPDDDGYLAVFQPDGSCFEASSAVITTARDIVYCTYANYTDPFGDGTGYAGGMRASSLPIYGGIIRDGEIASGSINHALLIYLSATALRREAVWPALTWDRSSGYTGSIPMGALLAIPASVDLRTLGLETPQGMVIARTAQDYGIYVAERGGSGGATIRSEIGNPDIADESWDHTAQAADLNRIVDALYRVTNNSPTSIGGGGDTRFPYRSSTSTLFDSPRSIFVSELENP